MIIVHQVQGSGRSIDVDAKQRRLLIDPTTNVVRRQALPPENRDGTARNEGGPLKGLTSSFLKHLYNPRK